jgi:tetrapyrrole methylase family protein/MazG family protein
MAVLRSRDGCPWDRKQTHETLRPFLLEEAYELLETIDRGEFDKLPGELGDVLFQCVFHAQIGAEAKRFDIVDAVQSITEKLIRRHPHVFTASGRPLRTQKRGASTTRRLKSSTEVLTQWEAIKAAEQAGKGEKKRILAGVPASMPALLRAHEIGTRVAAVGFDWDTASDVIDKVDEEVREFRDALTESPARAEEELGDLLFSIANLARKLGLEPESALRKANEKFSRRFDQVEASLERRGSSVHRASQPEMEAEWQAVKRAAPRARGRSRPSRKR